MLVMPLGLKARVIDLPLATILIVVGTLLYSAKYIDVSEKYQKRLMRSEEMGYYLTTNLNFMLQACESKFATDKNVCQVLNENLESFNLLSGELMRKKLEDAFKSDRSNYRKAVSFVTDRKNWDVEKSPYKALSSFAPFK